MWVFVNLNGALYQPPEAENWNPSTPGPETSEKIFICFVGEPDLKMSAVQSNSLIMVLRASDLHLDISSYQYIVVVIHL